MKKLIKFRNDLDNDRFTYRIQFFAEDTPMYVAQNRESIDRVDILIPTYEKGHNGEYKLRYYSRTYNYNPTQNSFSFTDFSPINSPDATLVWDESTLSNVIEETTISIGTVQKTYSYPREVNRTTLFSSNSNYTSYHAFTENIVNWEFTTHTTTETIVVNINHDPTFVNDIEDYPAIIPTINIDINATGYQINDIYILTYSYDYEKQQVTVNYHKSSNLFRDTLTSDKFYSKLYNFDGSSINNVSKKISFQVLNGWTLTNTWSLQKSIINSRTIDVTLGEKTKTNLSPLFAQIKSTNSHQPPLFSCEKKIGLRFRCESPSLDIYFVNENTLNNVSYDRVDVLIPTYKKDSSGLISKFTYIRKIYGMENNKLVSTGFIELNSDDARIFNVIPSIFPNKETRFFQEDIIVQLHELAPSTIVRDMVVLRESFGPTIDNVISIITFDEYELDSGSNYAERGIYPTIKITPNYSINEPTLVITYKYDYDRNLVVITKHNINFYLTSSSNTFFSPSEVYPFNGNHSIPNDYLITETTFLLEGPPTFDKLIPSTIESAMTIGNKNYFNIKPYHGTYKIIPLLPTSSQFASERKFKTLLGISHTYEFIRNGSEIGLHIIETSNKKSQLSVDRFDLFIPTYSVGTGLANKLQYQVTSFGIDSKTKDIVNSEFNVVMDRNQTLFWHSPSSRKVFSSNPTMMFIEHGTVQNFGELGNLTKFRINNMNDYIEVSYVNSLASTKQINILREVGYFDDTLTNIDPMFILAYQYDYINGYVIVTYHPLDQYMIIPSNNYDIESRVFPFNGPMSVAEHIKTVNSIIRPASLVSDDGFIGYGDPNSSGCIKSVVRIGEETDLDLSPLVGCSVCFV
jgi:hypothetical protein